MNRNETELSRCLKALSLFLSPHWLVNRGETVVHVFRIRALTANTDPERRGPFNTHGLVFLFGYLAVWVYEYHKAREPKVETNPTDFMSRRQGEENRSRARTERGFCGSAWRECMPKTELQQKCVWNALMTHIAFRERVHAEHHHVCVFQVHDCSSRAFDGGVFCSGSSLTWTSVSVFWAVVVAPRLTERRRLRVTRAAWFGLVSRGVNSVTRRK